MFLSPPELSAVSMIHIKAADFTISGFCFTMNSEAKTGKDGILVKTAEEICMVFNETWKMEEYMLNTKWEDLPAEVQARAVDCGIDLMIALIVGSHGEQFKNGIRMTEYLKDGDLEIPGCDKGFSFMGAAFAMGHASNSFDIDDGHNMIKGHPGTSFVGGVLAAALEKNVSYREYLTALTVSYDLAVRMGLALQDHYGFLHSTGTYGAVATAAGIGRIFGFTKEQEKTAISMAEFHAPMTPVMRAVEYPSMNKDGVPFGAMVGTLAALDTMAGESAKTHLLELPEYEKYLDSLGKVYEIMNLYFKPYTCCRWAHQPIQASIELMKEKKISSSQVKRVKVHTFRSAAALSKIVPHETDEAQYNIAFPVASAIVHGDVGYRQICNAALDNPDVLEMMKRLEFVVDEALDAQFPEKRLASVEMELNDGTVYRTRVYAADGEATDHVDHSWFVKKFNRILSPFLTDTGKTVVMRILTENLDASVRDVVADINVAMKNYAN